ncbi:MAG: DUF5606 domain-containing protein [Prolixibacteraceae bacterium]|jgi:hypothetical protein|nr:DUF5606 domain-containing protein [Prolixibacteraceae bacterium]
MLKDILAISGQAGLFKTVSKGNNSVIVESLLSGKRFPAHSTNKIISLEDIAIFTINEEVPLKDVLKKIAEKEDFKKSIDHKLSGNILKEYFKEILPDFDEDRVYVSDIKKVIQWYNILQEKEMLSFEDEEAEKPAEETPETPEIKETKE